MKIFIKILFLSFLIIPAKLSYGQSTGPTTDTTHVVKKNDKSVDDSRQRNMNQDKKLKQDQDQNDGTDQNQGPEAAPDNKSQVKSVNSTRPDMTRVRNARPPSIMRPSGSLLPRGIGRPGGALRPGGH